MNDKLVFLGLLYFVQGIPYGLQSSLLPVYLRGAGHSLTRIGFTKILYFPWVLKVLWAPLVDRVSTKQRWLADNSRKGGQGMEAIKPWKVWRKLVAVPGTPWTVLYVLTYKLGEQGAVAMFPLFLLDHHMTARELGFWNGVIAMGFSIGGSSLGGLLLTRFSIGAIMRRVFVLRTISMVFQSSLLTVLEPSTLLKGLAVLSLSVQHFLGGLITTLTFTTMMHCSQRADEGIQATHYSFLATLEVLGKLTFSAVAGGVVDWFGFQVAFLLFLTLSAGTALHVWTATFTGALREHQLKDQPK